MSTDFNDIDNDSFCYLIYKRVEAVFQPLPDTIKYGAISFLEVQKIDFIPAFARGELERLIQGKFNDVKNVKILSIEEVNEFSDEARLQLYRDCKKNFYHSNDIWFIVKSFIKEIKSFSRSCIGDSAPRRSQAPSVAKEDNNHSPRWEAVQTIKAAGEIPAPDFGDGGAAGMVAAADRARLVDSNDKIADNSDYLPKIYNLLQNRFIR